MDYWQIKDVIRRWIPRQTVVLAATKGHKQRSGRRIPNDVREFNVMQGEFQKPVWWKDKNLPLDDIGSAIEVSRKAAGCPSPLNIDVWDGTLCPFQCRYCFADTARSTLYSAFFANSAGMIRNANIDRVLPGLRKDIEDGRSGKVCSWSPAKRAIHQGIPVRIGVRFENFIRQEKKAGVTLRLLNALADLAYPVIIDTKSALLGEGPYVEALARNPAGAVVQFSLSSADDAFLRRMEPGAPSATERFAAMKALNRAGVRATPRMEPFMPFLSDSREMMEDYAGKALDAGVEWMCFDAFSASVGSVRVSRAFALAGFDFERLYLAGSDSRMVAGAMLWGIMDFFRGKGIKCSTYDDVNSEVNADPLCCNCEGAMNAGLNYGSTKMAQEFLRSIAPMSAGWAEYEAWVDANGGFLSRALQTEMWKLWNLDGDPAYSLDWLAVVPQGRDEHGLRWRFAEGGNPTLRRSLEWVKKEGERWL